MMYLIASVLPAPEMPLTTIDWSLPPPSNDAYAVSAVTKRCGSGSFAEPRCARLVVGAARERGGGEGLVERDLERLVVDRARRRGRVVVLELLADILVVVVVAGGRARAGGGGRARADDRLLDLLEHLRILVGRSRVGTEAALF